MIFMDPGIVPNICFDNCVKHSYNEIRRCNEAWQKMSHLLGSMNRKHEIQGCIQVCDWCFFKAEVQFPRHACEEICVEAFPPDCKDFEEVYGYIYPKNITKT